MIWVALLYGLVALWTIPYFVVGFIEEMKDEKPFKRWETEDTVTVTVVGVITAAGWLIVLVFWLGDKLFSAKPIKRVALKYHNYIARIHEEAEPR